VVVKQLWQWRPFSRSDALGDVEGIGKTIMADDKQIIDFLKQNSPSGKFKPHAFYSEASDSLTFYFSDEPDYAERLHSRVTVFYSMKDRQLVGCRIKNVKRVLDDVGSFPVEINHGGAQVTMLFLAFRGNVFETDEAREIWKTLVEKSRFIEDILTDGDDTTPYVTA